LLRGEVLDRIYYHEHPLRILKYSAKNIWLLIFPLIRIIMVTHLDLNAFYNWAKGAVFDIIVLVLIIVFGILKWSFSKVIITESALIHENGIFIKTRKIIPYNNLSAVTCEEMCYLKVFNAVRFYADTCAGILKSTDMRLLLSHDVCREIERVSKVSSQKRASVRHTPSMLLILFFSILFSSSFTGVVYVAVFLFQSGQIANDLVYRFIDRITEKASKFLIVNIPYAVLFVIIFMLTAWIVSFVTNLIRYSRFTVARDNNRFINVSFGVINERKYRVCLDKVNYYYFKQNFLMKIFRVTSVNVSCAGYAENRGRIFPILLPMARRSGIEKDLRKIADINYVSKRTYYPGFLSLWTYICGAVGIIIIIFPVIYILPRFVPWLSDAARFLVIMAEIPAVWYLIVRFAALFTSGISIADDIVFVRYSKGFDFFTIIGEKSKLVKLDVRQNLFQKYISKKCTLGFFFHGEMAVRHYVRAVKYNDAIEIAKKLGMEVE